MEKTSVFVDGQLVRKRRVEMLQMSQKKFAKFVGISERTVQGIERGESPIRVSTVGLLCRALDEPFEILVKSDGVYVQPESSHDFDEDDVRVVWEHLNEEASVEEIARWLNMLRPLLSVEQIKVIEAAMGSVHATLRMSELAIKQLAYEAIANSNGEIILDDELIARLAERKCVAITAQTKSLDERVHQRAAMSYWSILASEAEELLEQLTQLIEQHLDSLSEFRKVDAFSSMSILKEVVWGRRGWGPNKTVTNNEGMPSYLQKLRKPTS